MSHLLLPRPLRAIGESTTPLFRSTSHQFSGMRCLSIFFSPPLRNSTRPTLFSARRSAPQLRSFTKMSSEDEGLDEFLDYMENLKNFERIGIPAGAGTDSDDGFDLGRMRRLLHRLGDPHTHFRAVHIAGTKGKGSTSAFLSNILREEGYSVGCYTSPHLLTIRERISLGRNGNPVSPKVLNDIFHHVRGILDESTKLEGGALTHFEVFTALAYKIFSEEKVDIAVIEAGLGGARDATNVLRNSEVAASIITTIGEEHLAALGGTLESIAVAKSGIVKHGRPLVIGGPFEPHIERILRNRASTMNSTVVSACDPGIHSTVKSFGMDGMPYQSCDIHIHVRDPIELSVDLPNIKLCMIGSHQVQNAVTATCAALCLRNQGWKISDKSIRNGLEHIQLPGRSQFLRPREAEALGLSESSVMIDGAHTEASAKCLADVRKMIFPDSQWALVVAMASDKDHLAFAKKLLAGGRPEVVILTEVYIAGGTTRMASASSLKDAWISSAKELGIDVLDIGVIAHAEDNGVYTDLSSRSSDNRSPVLIGCKIAPVVDLLKVAERLLKSRPTDKSSFVTLTGSMHIVSSLLSVLSK